MVENSLVLNSNYNGINCIQKIDAERPCDKIWFTAKQIEEWSGMPKKTLWRWLRRIEKAHRISSCSDLNKTPIPDSCGVPHETTLYNLNVLNQLAMVCIDNEKLNDISCKSSGILSEVETTGTYSVKPKDSYMIEDPIERAKAWIAEQEEKQKLALEAKFEKEQKELALTQRDEAIRTKAYISDKKTATALGRVGGLVKENNYLKETLALAGEYRTILAVAQKNGLRDWHYISWHKLKQYCKEHGLVIKEISDIRFGTVKTYPVEAFKAIYPELKI